MSFVGPRPDVSGYYNNLERGRKDSFTLKPGLTSEASLKYFDEEAYFTTTKKIHRNTMMLLFFPR
jgi:lipopolysaccharide/colanic/teichoic acid biosynthesis glycosyltransferase